MITAKVGYRPVITAIARYKLNFRPETTDKARCRLMVTAIVIFQSFLDAKTTYNGYS